MVLYIEVILDQLFHKLVKTWHLPGFEKCQSFLKASLKTPTLLSSIYLTKISFSFHYGEKFLLGASRSPVVRRECA